MRLPLACIHLIQRLCPPVPLLHLREARAREKLKKDLEVGSLSTAAAVGGPPTPLVHSVVWNCETAVCHPGEDL